jgi:hypothetical protein
MTLSSLTRVPGASAAGSTPPAASSTLVRSNRVAASAVSPPVDVPNRISADLGSRNQQALPVTNKAVQTAPAVAELSVLNLATPSLALSAAGASLSKNAAVALAALMLTHQFEGTSAAAVLAFGLPEALSRVIDEGRGKQDMSSGPIIGAVVGVLVVVGVIVAAALLCCRPRAQRPIANDPASRYPMPPETAVDRDGNPVSGRASRHGHHHSGQRRSSHHHHHGNHHR